MLCVVRDVQCKTRESPSVKLSKLVSDKFIHSEVVIAPKLPNLLPRRESKAGQKGYGLDAGANPPCSEFKQVTETMTNFNFISAPETCHSQI